MPDLPGRALVLAEELPDFDPDQVTPGPVGFIVTFALVVVVIFLLRDLSRRVRRLTLRGQAMERDAAERAAVERDAAERAAVDGPPGVGSDPAPGPHVETGDERPREER